MLRLTIGDNDYTITFRHKQFPPAYPATVEIRQGSKVKTKTIMRRHKRRGWTECRIMCGPVGGRATFGWLGYTECGRSKLDPFTKAVGRKYALERALDAMQGAVALYVVGEIAVACVKRGWLPPAEKVGDGMSSSDVATPVATQEWRPIVDPHNSESYKQPDD